MNAPPTGAWRRERLVVDGWDLSAQPAWWLQSPSGPFVDVRGVLPDVLEPSAFAGHCSVRGAAAVWHHVLDLSPPLAEQDRAELEDRGDALIERGRTAVDGIEVPFEERWIRAAQPSSIVLAQAPTSAGPGAAILFDGWSGVLTAHGAVVLDPSGSVQAAAGRPPVTSVTGDHLVVDGVEWSTTDAPSWGAAPLEVD